jgi:hypothetical protein
MRLAHHGARVQRERCLQSADTSHLAHVRAGPARKRRDDAGGCYFDSEWDNRSWVCWIWGQDFGSDGDELRAAFSAGSTGFDGV